MLLFNEFIVSVGVGWSCSNRSRNSNQNWLSWIPLLSTCSSIASIYATTIKCHASVLMYIVLLCEVSTISNARRMCGGRNETPRACSVVRFLSLSLCFRHYAHHRLRVYIYTYINIDLYRLVSATWLTLLWCIFVRTWFSSVFSLMSTSMRVKNEPWFTLSTNQNFRYIEPVSSHWITEHWMDPDHPWIP